MPRFLLPDAWLLDAERYQERAAVVVEDGRVRALVDAGALPSDAEVERFEGELWTAAPVLAHAHLESFDAPAEGWPRASFAAWARALLAWRETAERIDGEASSRASLAELAASGCGWVLSHVAEPAARSAAHERAEALPELVAWPEVFAPDAADASALAERWAAEAPPGIALHAPFSVALPIARAAFAASAAVSIHLGEHEDERRLLVEGSGPLRELFESRGRRIGDERWPSPVDWLADAGGLRSGTLAVHATDLDASELRRLQEAGVLVVFCPGTHRYFERAAPAFAAAGVLPAIGCDSRASNARLDPLRELRLARAIVPEFPPQRWWRALTECGAAALRRADVGRVEPGAVARFLRLPILEERGPAAVCARLCEDDSLRALGPPFASAGASS